MAMPAVSILLVLLAQSGRPVPQQAATSISIRFIEVITMALSFTVGGARDTFEPRFAAEVAELLDNAFGAEREWERSTALHYGEQADWGWAELQRRAADELSQQQFPTCWQSERSRGESFCPRRFRRS